MTQNSNIINRCRKFVSKWWDKNQQDIVNSTLQLFAYTFALVMFVGVIFYIFLRIVKTGAQPIEMATVTAVLGGITLAGGFVKGGVKGYGFSMRRIGAIYILATIALLIFGFYVTIDGALPSDRDNLTNAYLVLVMGVTLYGGAIAFTIATTWLLLLMPKLFKKFEIESK